MFRFWFVCVCVLFLCVFGLFMPFKMFFLSIFGMTFEVNETGTKFNSHNLTKCIARGQLTQLKKLLYVALLMQNNKYQTVVLIFCVLNSFQLVIQQVIENVLRFQIYTILDLSITIWISFPLIWFCFRGVFFVYFATGNLLLHNICVFVCGAELFPFF